MDQCLLNYPSKSLKLIVNGEDAQKYEYPFNVYLVYRLEVGVENLANENATASVFISGICTGVLIDKRAVLTAAHCLRLEIKKYETILNNQTLYNHSLIYSHVKVFIGLNNLDSLDMDQIKKQTESSKLSKRTISRAFVVSNRITIVFSSIEFGFKL